MEKGGRVVRESGQVNVGADFSPPSNWSSFAYIGFVLQHVTTKTLFDRGSALPASRTR